MRIASGGKKRTVEIVEIPSRLIFFQFSVETQDFSAGLVL